MVLLLCGDLSRLCRPFSCLLCSSRPCTLVCLSETGINRALLDHPGGRSPVPKMRNRRVREDRHAVSPHENNGICGLKGFRKQNENIDLSHYSLTGVTPERCLQPVGLGLLWGVGGVGGGGSGTAFPFLPETCLLGLPEGQGLRTPLFGLLPLLPRALGINKCVSMFFRFFLA